MKRFPVNDPWWATSYPVFPLYPYGGGVVSIISLCFVNIAFRDKLSQGRTLVPQTTLIGNNYRWNWEYKTKNGWSGSGVVTDPLFPPIGVVPALSHTRTIVAFPEELASSEPLLQEILDLESL